MAEDIPWARYGCIEVRPVRVQDELANGRIVVIAGYQGVSYKKEITTLGRSILMAESNIHHVPAFATRLYVIERGEIIFGGPPEAVRADAAILRLIGGAA